MRFFGVLEAQRFHALGVRRRWLATGLADIEKGLVCGADRPGAQTAHDDPIAPPVAEGVLAEGMQ
jgi:hypothetical protein